MSSTGSDTQRRISGPKVVVPLLIATGLVAVIFLTIQLSGRGAKARNYLNLSYTAGLRDLDEGFYVDAVKNFTPMVEAGDQPAAVGFRGEAYLRMEKFREAEADFRRAIQLEPNLPANHAGLADALASQGHLEQSLEHLNKAIELHRTDAPPPGRVRRRGDVLTDVLTRRMRILQTLERHDEAAEDAEELKTILRDRAVPGADSDARPSP
jgi:tetratricopeptide (TPR) repeat protein